MQNPADANAGTSVPTPSNQNTPTARSSEIAAVAPPAARAADSAVKAAVAEIGGPSGPEPTRFGDWEKKGRCIDF
jgi:hypothetical protein